MYYCTALDPQHFGLLNPDPQKYVECGSMNPNPKAKYQPKIAKKNLLLS